MKKFYHTIHFQLKVPKNLWRKQSFCYNQCLSIAYLELRQRSILRRKNCWQKSNCFKLLHRLCCQTSIKVKIFFLNYMLAVIWLISPHYSY